MCFVDSKDREAKSTSHSEFVGAMGVFQEQLHANKWKSLAGPGHELACVTGQ